MKPYFENEHVTIFHGDCREVLPQLEVRADLIIADPPFEETKLKWDRLVRGWGAVIFEVAKPVASMWVCGSLRMFMRTVDEFEVWTYAEEQIWEKHNGASNAGDRLRRVHENCAHFYKGSWAELYNDIPRDPTVEMKGTSTRRTGAGKHLGNYKPCTYERGKDRLQRSVIKMPNCHGYAQHPTQKPIGLFGNWIRMSCPPGGVVFEPFMGAGTGLRAAMDNHRRGVGCDISERNCEIAAQRCSQGVLSLGVT